MLRCREVTRMIASDELATAGWLKQLEVRFHLLMCQHCRRYAAQIRVLGNLARRAWAHGEEDRAALERITRNVLARARAVGDPGPRAGEDPRSPDP